MPTDSFSIPGFDRDFGSRDKACIAAFAQEGCGKTRLGATAEEWAQERGTVPAWMVMDRKTRKTVRDTYELMGHERAPFMNTDDFVPREDTLRLATLDDVQEIKKIYAKGFDRILKMAVDLGKQAKVDPIIFDSGSQLWDWIAYSHFGRKSEVGKARVWGPPKQDWTDLFDALSHKTVLITIKAKPEWKNDATTGKFAADGPPHLGYTVTSVVRLEQAKGRVLEPHESFEDRFSLDLIESQDNKGIEGTTLLTGAAITFSNLMSQLRPND